MTPITLTMDRSFKGVGRIKKATGTTVPAVRRALSRMLTALHESGRLDILRAIRDGQLAMLQVYDAYQRHALDTLPLAGALKPLSDTMRKWIDSADVSPKHAVSLGVSLGYFIAAQPDAKVGDLPGILERLRDSLGVKHPRSFNIARSAAQAFVRSALKRSHPIYAAITDVETRKVVVQRKHQPLSRQQMDNWFGGGDEVSLIAWTMATTGMGEKELWGEWYVVAGHVHIQGTKRKGRIRDVPLVLLPHRPTIHPRTFSDKLRERSGRAITPYDLRRTYANWMEAAGVTRTRRRLYMGHGVGDVTGLYELHEVAAFLMEDGQKMRDFLGLPTISHTMEIAR